MKARFPSTCPGCGGGIRQGKEIAKGEDGRWVHKHCAPEALEMP